MEFICGDFFKRLCKYSVPDYTGPHAHKFQFKIHPTGSEKRFFIKTEYLNHFFSNFDVKYDYELFTHNSDLNITEESAERVFNSHPNITTWYAQNLNYRHPKLQPIPIGIANPKWEHGNQDILRDIQRQDLEKEKAVYVNFDVYTNAPERNHCLSQIKLPMESRMPFRDHLRALGSSYFCISPNGNGLDCHRHWEALYLKTIPIITRSVLADLLVEKGLPILCLDDWSDFSTLSLTPSLYGKIWGDFAVSTLNSRFWDE